MTTIENKAQELLDEESERARDSILNAAEQIINDETKKGEDIRRALRDYFKDETKKIDPEWREE